MSSFSNDSKSKDSQRSTSVKPRVTIERQRGPKQTSYYQQFLSFEASTTGKKPTSYREKLKQKPIIAPKIKVVIDPNHSFTNEFIEPTDSISTQSPSIKLGDREEYRSGLHGNAELSTPISKHKRNLSFTGSENDQQNFRKEPTSTDRIRSNLVIPDVDSKQHSLTNPATPKSRMSPREIGSKELMSVLKRKYGGSLLEVTPIDMPLECPEIVLVCKGSRVQAFSVKSVRS